MNMKKATINNKEIIYDAEEFEFVGDSQPSFLKYIGDGSKPIHNPKGNTSCMLMFSNYIFKHLDLSEFDTSEVTNMSLMFAGAKFEKLTLGKFDTSKVTDMSYMFQGCCNLKSVDTSDWNVSNVRDMEDMFSKCNNLKKLDVSKWDVSNVTNMAFMFYNCHWLDRHICTKNWNMSSIEHMDCIFEDCYEHPIFGSWVIPFQSMLTVPENASIQHVEFGDYKDPIHFNLE